MVLKVTALPTLKGQPAEAEEVLAKPSRAGVSGLPISTTQLRQCYVPRGIQRRPLPTRARWFCGDGPSDRSASLQQMARVLGRDQLASPSALTNGYNRSLGVRCMSASTGLRPGHAGRGFFVLNLSLSDAAQASAHPSFLVMRGGIAASRVPSPGRQGRRLRSAPFSFW